MHYGESVQGILPTVDNAVLAQHYVEKSAGRPGADRHGWFGGSTDQVDVNGCVVRRSLWYSARLMGT